jgi:hypothetical protein
MISAVRVPLAWSPPHGGQHHEDADTDAYRENDHYEQRDPGDQSVIFVTPIGRLIPGGDHD